VSWRHITDWAKQWPPTLCLADWLGRGRGRLRFLDHLQTAPAPRRPDMTNWQQHELAAVWIGHATVLLRIGGATILTDPVFSIRIGLGFGLFTAGPRRFYAPALDLHHLPPLDLIIVSHAHFDHLDRPTLARLPKRTPLITSRRNADLIRDLGFRSITEMRWGQSVQLGSLRVTSQRIEHWGARTFHDPQRGYGAFLIEAGGQRVFYGADTGHCNYLREVGKVDLAIFGIGGYDPYIQAHATPEQAWDMANQMRADYLLPVHHSTFRLSYEPMDEPMERMMAAAGSDDDRIVIREIGGQWAR